MVHLNGKNTFTATEGHHVRWLEGKFNLAEIAQCVFEYELILIFSETAVSDCKHAHMHILKTGAFVDS
jgi:hypothetical protein